MSEYFIIKNCQSTCKPLVNHNLFTGGGLKCCKYYPNVTQRHKVNKCCWKNAKRLALICISASLCCLPEANTPLYINYTSIKKKKKRITEQPKWITEEIKGKKNT